MTALQINKTVEQLVDLFLSNDPELDDDGFMAESGCEETHDGDSFDDNYDQVMFRKKYGRDLKLMGDDILKGYENTKHQSLSVAVKTFFQRNLVPDGQDSEACWSRFKETLDSAIKDTGLDDSSKMLATVLMSIRGLAYLGSGVKDFTLRYIREMKLDEDIRKFEEKFEASGKHPSTD